MTNKLIGIEGNRVVPIESKKEPTEKMYEFTLLPTDQSGNSTVFNSFGVLIVTPGFVGIGDKDGTEVRTVVPLNNLKYVRPAEVAPIGAPQGSA